MFSWEELQEVFIISDTHFWHDKIVEYCDRPIDWQYTVKSNWNNVVKPEDTVLHLGDFSLGNKNKTKEIVDSLNGNIYMIKGNHDRHGKKWYKDVGVTIIKPFVIQEGDDIIYFTHRPLVGNSNLYGCWNIHGHWHNKAPLTWEGSNGCKYMNVSVEQMGYGPRKFKRLFLVLKHLQIDKTVI